jgi:hypothetical protein
MTAQWIARPWTGHDATSVIVEDKFGIAGNRVVAQCDREDEARLIAAAPELLAALQPFVSFNSSEEWIELTVRTESVTRARAAIAKATGIAV